MDHKPLVVIFKKGHSYINIEAAAKSVKNTSIQSENHIQAWTRPVQDWLSRQNHIKNKDEEILGMQLGINTINY